MVCSQQATPGVQAEGEGMGSGIVCMSSSSKHCILLFQHPGQRANTGNREMQQYEIPIRSAGYSLPAHHGLPLPHRHDSFSFAGEQDINAYRILTKAEDLAVKPVSGAER